MSRRRTVVFDVGGVIVRAAGHRLALLSNMTVPCAAHLETTHECFD